VEYSEVNETDYERPSCRSDVEIRMIITLERVKESREEFFVRISIAYCSSLELPISLVIYALVSPRDTAFKYRQLLRRGEIELVQKERMVKTCLSAQDVHPDAGCVSSC
jgi:hypothetical protein